MYNINKVIMNKYHHKFKRFFQKIGIAINKRLKQPHYELSAGEREALAIVNKLIKDSESDLLTCPNSGKYYIKSSKKKMLIVIGHKEINIINSIYSYAVHLTDRTENNVRNVFLDEVELRRDKMEQEFKSSVTHSLKTIYQNLSNESK
jgi:hypothetical protein